MHGTKLPRWQCGASVMRMPGRRGGFSPVVLSVSGNGFVNAASSELCSPELVSVSQVRCLPQAWRLRTSTFLARRNLSKVLRQWLRNTLRQVLASARSSNVFAQAGSSVTGLRNVLFAHRRLMHGACRKSSWHLPERLATAPRQ